MAQEWPRKAQESPGRAQKSPGEAQEKPRRSPERPRTAQMQTINQKRCQKACVCARARARLRHSQYTLQRTVHKKKYQKDCVCARARARPRQNRCHDDTWDVPKTPLLRTCARTFDAQKQHPDFKNVQKKPRVRTCARTQSVPVQTGKRPNLIYSCRRSDCNTHRGFAAGCNPPPRSA